MVEKQENSSAGFDPLAWINEEETTSHTNDEVKAAPVDDEKAIEIEPSAPTIDGSVHEDKSKNDSKFILNKKLNIQSVAELYEQLLVMLKNQDIIEIDASAVESIDTASLQLLVVFKKTAIECHKQVSIDFPSDVFIDAAKMLALSEILEVDHAAAGLF